ncbi:MAG: hypothetical protein IJ740_03410 [Ruminococcus sp.]|nr:hypothetical protein [Ruminococcus sp.]
MPVKYCRACGEEFIAKSRKIKYCVNCQNGTNVNHPRKRTGIKADCEKNVYKGEGRDKPCKSGVNINAVLNECREEKGESPVSYGKIMARLSGRK